MSLTYTVTHDQLNRLQDLLLLAVTHNYAQNFGLSKVAIQDSMDLVGEVRQANKKGGAE